MPIFAAVGIGSTADSPVLKAEHPESEAAKPPED
jgi:hypothetical protein